RAGVDVVVVDHHLVPDEPLPALAFLNPHRPDCGFAFKGLCSAGLCLSLGAALRKRMGGNLDLRPWLDLVALGTVADVAPLTGDNRALVRAGLRLLGGERARPGVVALRELARMKPGKVTSGDIAFRMAPRLNAAGRMGDPALTLALLRAKTSGEAQQVAAAIEQLNQERKSTEKAVTAEALAQVEQVYGSSPGEAVVAVGDGWHRGVVGIVAARLVDRFGVPAVVLGFDDGAAGLPTDVAHGSGRAPGGGSVYDVVSAAASLLETFGGHRAAVGLSVTRAQVDALRAAISDRSRSITPPPETDLLVDVTLDGVAFGVPKAADLLRLEPVGEGNPDPLYLVEGAVVESVRTVGDGGSHLKLGVRLGRARLSAFGFDMADRAPTEGNPVSLVGHLRPDTWRGGDAVELHITSMPTL
ncbi:MAG: single-stranded-DNA-specific exonuclease RecJ, partial [Myxococcales bacterium]|nr:single-stranded-DNA-specific exonuclease RecJ [Myxococcales bacterium]